MTNSANNSVSSEVEIDDCDKCDFPDCPCEQDYYCPYEFPEPVRKLADQLLAICDQYGFDCRTGDFAMLVDEDGLGRFLCDAERNRRWPLFKSAIADLRELPESNDAYEEVARRQADRLLKWKRADREQWRLAGRKSAPRNPLLSPWTPQDAIILNGIEKLQNEGYTLEQITEQANTKGFILKVPINVHAKEEIRECNFFLGAMDGYFHDSTTNFRMFTVKAWIEALIIRGERNAK